MVSKQIARRLDEVAVGPAVVVVDNAAAAESAVARSVNLESAASS